MSEFPYAILRVAKVKSWGQLSQVGAHNARDRRTPNADDARTELNRLLAGVRDPVAGVRAALDAAGIVRLRRNGVLAIEMILGASPSYFRSDRLDGGERWHRGRLQLWVERSMAWLSQEHGERLVSVQLHLDESTPHLHAVIVPIDRTERKRGQGARLNARRWFGGADVLSGLQDRYAEAVASLGLVRGVRRSVARYEDVRAFYAHLGDAERLLGQVERAALSYGPRAAAEVAELRREHDVRSQRVR